MWGRRLPLPHLSATVAKGDEYSAENDDAANDLAERRRFVEDEVGEGGRHHRLTDNGDGDESG